MAAELIPGLPDDDAALQCLIRLPFSVLQIARRVCKRWKHEITSPSFYRLRKVAGVARPVLAISNICYKQIALYEPTNDVWSWLPVNSDRSLFGQVVVVGHELVVIGRQRPPTNVVDVHNLLTGVWRRGAPMPGPRRAFFACAAATESLAMVFVAGGIDQKGQELRSALAYNVATDAWVLLPDMEHPRGQCTGSFVGGLFHVFGGHRRSETFDATAGRWTTRPMEIDRRTGVAAVEGKVYVCNSDGRMWVHSLRDGWRQLSSFPEKLCLLWMFRAHMAAWDDRVMVIGWGWVRLKQMAYILEEERWRKVALPMADSGHVESLCCFQF